MSRPPIGLELVSARSDEYGDYTREQLIQQIAPPLGRVLDVGCARGNRQRQLVSLGATAIAGVEIDAEYAEAARSQYDTVIHGSIEDPLPWPSGSFDTILCYDVLEHLYDPWSVVARLCELLAPDGRLHVSIPNARNLDTWRPLVLGGTFAYTTSGLRDVTHLRFFTRRDVVAMLEAGDFEIVHCHGTGSDSLKRRALRAVLPRVADEFFTYQWILLARPRQPGQ